jgi:DNA-binding response OmpR family regulator
MINSKELIQYTKNLTLLFAEDHDELRISTTEILKNFFKKVDSVKDGEEALSLYKDSYKNDKPYDLVLTDIRMPKMDGVVLTEKIYEINHTQTIIVLSAHDESTYLLPLINLGIEQFIKKPIDYQELLRVLLNIAKKLSSTLLSETLNMSNVYLADNFSFNQETKILLNDNETIYLTKYEIIFLELLTQNSGKIFSNEDIVLYFNSINETIDSQNIRKLVSKLRKKLPDETLESIYGVGYRIVPFFK